MFYSFCGKPLPEQIFSEVCVSFLGCITRTQDNSSMANTSSFPRCWGLNIDFALQHTRLVFRPTYQEPQISQGSVKKALNFELKVARSAPVGRTASLRIRFLCGDVTTPGGSR